MPKITTRPKGTLRDIAQALNLSDGTVSRALNGRGDIAQETRARVAEIAAELNYTPRRQSRKAESSLNRVAVCLGNLCANANGIPDPSYVGINLLTQLEQAASQTDVGVMVSFVDAMAPNSNIQNLPIFRPGEAQGIILVYPFPEETVQQLARLAPVVSIEHVYPSVSLDVIGPTHAVDAMSAVEYLYKLGHKRIAYVSDEDARGHKLTLGLRHAGFVSGLARCNLQYRPDDVINIFSPPVSKSDLAQCVAARMRDGVTAVITSIDRHGQLLWDELPKLGIQIPQDVSLVGIGGIRQTAGLPQLTTWRCNYEKIAVAALDALRSRYSRQRSTDLYMEIASIFVQGESSAPPRQ